MVNASTAGAHAGGAPAPDPHVVSSAGLRPAVVLQAIFVGACVYLGLMAMHDFDFANSPPTSIGSGIGAALGILVYTRKLEQPTTVLTALTPEQAARTILALSPYRRFVASPAEASGKIKLSPPEKRGASPILLAPRSDGTLVSCTRGQFAYLKNRLG
jgi:hypothetical protein